MGQGIFQRHLFQLQALQIPDSPIHVEDLEGGHRAPDDLRALMRVAIRAQPGEQLRHGRSTVDERRQPRHQAAAGNPLGIARRGQHVTPHELAFGEDRLPLHPDTGCQAWDCSREASVLDIGVRVGGRQACPTRSSL